MVSFQLSVSSSGGGQVISGAKIVDKS